MYVIVNDVWGDRSSAVVVAAALRVQCPLMYENQITTLCMRCNGYATADTEAIFFLYLAC